MEDKHVPTPDELIAKLQASDGIILVGEYSPAELVQRMYESLSPEEQKHLKKAFSDLRRIRQASKKFRQAHRNMIERTITGLPNREDSTDEEILAAVQQSVTIQERDMLGSDSTIIENCMLSAFHQVKAMFRWFGISGIGPSEEE